MKILFMGTPDFAVPSLQALIEAGHEIVGVFTQPDKPKNRGMKLLPTPVKVVALEHDIPVFQPTKLRDGTALETIQGLEPDLIVVAAYGRILPQEILDYPKLGCINVHSSLLPKYRGSAPIHWAILNGDAESGVTIMNVVLELDAGDIISQAVTPIDPDETVETLHDRLAHMGAKLLVDTVVAIENGTATRTPQQAELVTHAPMLSRALSPMDFTRPARELHNQVRGLIPWPAAVTELNGTRCKIFSTSVLAETTGKEPGTVIAADKKGLKIACGGGTVLQI
ncbi:MAG: methionyl-tRNA formyltransferase, partial [Ruminiclostridium sp.]|nr:methionyl-tRNA formyltransferase [Ruminiclostridium sp.]